MKTAVPHDARAEETIFFSNMTFGRVVDINWTGFGGGCTVCMYKPLLGESSLLISNTVTIEGILADGNIVMDVVLNRRRMQILEDELEKLVGSFSSQTNPHVRPKRVANSKLWTCNDFIYSDYTTAGGWKVMTQTMALWEVHTTSKLAQQEQQSSRLSRRVTLVRDT